MEIKGKKIFITGAASGIGRSTAIATARLGARLFLTDINKSGLEETVQMITAGGGEVCKHKAFNIADYNEVKSFADEIHSEFGSMDIIMNIAGIAVWGLVENFTHSYWQKVINVNLWGPIHSIECFAPAMVHAGKGGHIVNVSSAAGLTGAPWHIAYSATKWALVGISEVLRYDMMQHNIGVTVVCPGAVDTPLKNTIEILGIDANSEKMKNLKQRFSGHAISPDKAAELIIKGVEKKKFLVITSFDIKAVYFFKHHFFPVYHFIMIRISKLLNSVAAKS
jgi:NAD(P)-dependent dehydrogenase (short-subunit alcohol dehydrogenase family)